MLIHLIGISGTGMGSFAGLLQSLGHQVRGSDQNVYPPMSDKLKEWNIPVQQGYRPENLDPKPDLVVVGNVIRKDNPEAQEAFRQGLTTTSFPKALGDMFLANRHSIVVAGTHGKTTTSSLIAWMLTSAGKDPGMLIGGVPSNFQEGFRFGKGQEFVVEGDEYDTAFFDKVPKFLHYQPKTLVITSIEYDHADIYPNVEAIEQQFERVVRLVPADGRIILCARDFRALRVARASLAKVETYDQMGVASTSARASAAYQDFVASKVHETSEGMRFDVVHRGRGLGTFDLPIPGRHNVDNALAAIAVGHSLQLSVPAIQEGFRTFKGIARRQTVRSVTRGVRVIDDFAHHPTAVKVTIEAIKGQYPKGKLFAVFEPRSATSSRKFFQEAYEQSFDAADDIIIAGVGRKEISSEERLDTNALASSIASRTKRRARCIEDVNNIVQALALDVKSDDTILFMSNGGFGGIHDKMKEALEQSS